MLKKFIFSLTAIIALSLVVMAQDKALTLEGFIVDKACATGKVAKQADPQAAAANESKGCVLMANCDEERAWPLLWRQVYRVRWEGRCLGQGRARKEQKG